MKSSSQTQHSHTPGLMGGRVAVWLLGALALLSLLTFVFCRRLYAEGMADNLGTTKNFLVSDFYDPPNQNQVKSLLRGGEAYFQNGGRVVQIKEVQVESYATNGKTLFVARSPDCTYDRVNQTASSSNRIEAATGDGQFYIQGEGFHFEQTNLTFSISNQVYTKIRQETDTNSTP